MMNYMSQLTQQLRQLKLSGMLEHIELRFMEAQQNNLSYAEFLALLLEDELEKRHVRKLQRLLKAANIGNDKTIESFDFSFNPSINAAYIKQLASCRFIEKGEGIFFIGPTGTGKTHLAKALCHQACRKHFSVSFFPFYQLCNELNKAIATNKINALIKKLIKVDLLAIDEFAFKKINQQEAEILYTIVDARYAVKSVIITSNRAITDWAAIFPDPLIANAILDRLAHHSHQIVIKGESYRKKFIPKFENP